MLWLANHVVKFVETFAALCLAGEVDHAESIVHGELGRIAVSVNVAVIGLVGYQLIASEEAKAVVLAKTLYVVVEC